MIDGIINLLQKVSLFQKKLQDKVVNKKLLAFLICILLCINIIVWIFIIRGLGLDHSLINITLGSIFLGLFLLYLIILLKQQNFRNIIHIFLSEFVPINIVVGLSILTMNGESTSLYNVGLVSLLIIYPIINRIIIHISPWSITYIKTIFRSYNFLFFYFLVLHTILSIFGLSGFEFYSEWQDFIYLITNSSSRVDLIEFLLLVPLLYGCILGPMYVIKSYSKHHNITRNIFTGYIVIWFMILSLGSSPHYIEKITDSLVMKSHNKVKEYGRTYEGLSYNGFILHHAFLWRIKNNHTINEELFQMLFDSTPEEYYGEKIAKYRSNWDNAGTDISKTGKNAKVILEIGEVQSTIQDSNSGYILKNDFEFYFQNTETSNQEVVLFFQTPLKSSVIYNLKLGLNDELIGQAAPRGAARAVYENSLRKNIDPALIEKVGSNSYSVRIFPIPSIRNEENQGRQKISFSILSPIQNKNISYIPKFSFINLKTNKDSRFISKLYKNEVLIDESIKKGNKIDSFFLSSHTLEEDIFSNISFTSLQACLHPYIEDLVRIQNINIDSPTTTTDSQKTSIFFDQSSSVLRSNAQKEYKQIYTGIKNIFSDTNLYSYNFKVQKQAQVSDIKYWGYTDTNSILEYLHKNNIHGQQIFIVTDDSSFNFNEINREALTPQGNNIHVIKVGEKIKSYKQDFNMFIGASGGNFIEYNSQTFQYDLQDTINKSNNSKYTNCNQFEDIRTYQDNLNEKLLTFFDKYKDAELTYTLFPVLQRHIEIYFGDIPKSGLEKEDLIYQDYLLSGFNNNKAEKYTENEIRNIIKEYLTLLKQISDKDLVSNTIEHVHLLQAAWLSSLLLENIDSKEDYEIAKIQTEIAHYFGIVNHYNSLIAIETKNQQRQLDQLSAGENAYNITYKNFSTENSRGGGVRNPTINFGSDIGVNSGINFGGVDTTIKGGLPSNNYGSSYGPRFSNEISILGFYQIILYILCIINFLQMTFTFLKKKS